MDNLNTISEGIRAAFVAKNAARDEAVNRSRELVRYCSEAIRAIHRREWDKATDKMTHQGKKGSTRVGKWLKRLVAGEGFEPSTFGL